MTPEQWIVDALKEERASDILFSRYLGCKTYDERTRFVRMLSELVVEARAAAIHQKVISGKIKLCIVCSKPLSNLGQVVHAKRCRAALAKRNRDGLLTTPRAYT